MYCGLGEAQSSQYCRPKTLVASFPNSLAGSLKVAAALDYFLGDGKDRRDEIVLIASQSRRGGPLMALFEVRRELLTLV